jgi:hypothetical protein
VELDVPEGHKLAAAIKGEPGEIIYFTVESGSPGDKFSTREAYFYRVDYKGNVLKKTSVDTSEKTGLNIYAIDTSCRLSYDDGKTSSSGNK